MSIRAERCRDGLRFCRKTAGMTGITDASGGPPRGSGICQASQCRRADQDPAPRGPERITAEKGGTFRRAAGLENYITREIQQEAVFYNSFDSTGPTRVLSLLKSHGTEYLSGQDLADALEISRAAVRKHVRTIRELGYGVEARRRSGYRLVRGTDRLLPWEVAAVRTGRIGGRAYYFDEIGSTQDYAVGLARSGGEEGSVVVAERQTHGRGRMQRRWESPEGGIWMSVVLRPRLDGGTLPLVPLAAGVSLAEAIRRSAGVGPELKWPNDVTIGSKKVAGVIVEASVESGRPDYVVIGAGINFDTDAKKIEGALKGTPNFYGATSITRHSENAERLELVRGFFRELEKNTALLERGKTYTIIRDWTRRSGTVGRRVTALVDGRRVTGTARGVGQDGALLVETPDGTERVLAEDVAHLR